MEKLFLVQKRSASIPARHSNKATLTIFLKSYATLCSQVPPATTCATCASFSPSPDRLLLGRRGQPLLDFLQAVIHLLDELFDVDQTFVLAGLFAWVPIRLHHAV